MWDASTAVDSLGWTAEYRIPLSQMRYATGGSTTFGFMIWRTIERYTSQITWPLYRQSKPGFVSQFGELTGMDDLVNPRRAEFTPYMVTKNESRPTSAGFGRHQDLNIGGDLKYGVASNLTLTATINPDFGQVEADPSVLNLSAFESFFQERRPFFVEGRGQFSFDVNCSAVNCNGEGLFYSRRIGRAPQLADSYGDATSATATTILGAAKVTGRTPGGFAIGVLDAVTGHETGVNGATIEPLTNYGSDSGDAGPSQRRWQRRRACSPASTALNGSVEPVTCCTRARTSGPWTSGSACSTSTTRFQARSI